MMTSPKTDSIDSRRETISPACTLPVGNCLTNKGMNGRTAIKIESSPELQRPDLQRATSTTSHEAEIIAVTAPANIKASCTPSDPAEWSVDDVMRYLTSVDSGLSVHSQLFQKHVIKFVYYSLYCFSIIAYIVLKYFSFVCDRKLTERPYFFSHPK
jgi:hypothetical protein